MTLIGIFIALVFVLAIITRFFWQPILAWLDDALFYDIPASEANQSDEREQIREVLYRAQEPRYRWVYEQQPSIN